MEELFKQILSEQKEQTKLLQTIVDSLEQNINVELASIVRGDKFEDIAQRLSAATELSRRIF
ncbi:hypothetical protein [Enterococcus wangshanyuanii]|uniref:Transposase n=1 Tax=Enterococcus wangshanyuanii TaxID=2005703 RepID=A0ABQ1PTP0_9ENTE|nr:hypothetical protein [Enterococcus wangshanyuanii]GGD03731.1 hypothetical protein GCM10011573_36520 [Enterococcus wangshanyuanii]